MRVGVVGAGVMGAGVAETLAEFGHEVVLVDIDQEALVRAKASISQSLRMRRLFQKQSGLPDAAELLARVETSIEQTALKDAEFIIENVTENVEVKEDVYRSLDDLCAESTVFAADTSCVPIDHLARVTARPDRVVGIHFMNPVPLKTTVEVIQGPRTSEDTLTKVHSLLKSIGKTGIVVKDSPGFVSNRVLMLAINEAIRVLEEGVAGPEEIDRIFTQCFGHKMGPLQTADLIGLDTILLSLIVLRDSFSDPKFEPASLLRTKVEEGDLGRKSGSGFYEYGG